MDKKGRKTLIYYKSLYKNTLNLRTIYILERYIAITNVVKEAQFLVWINVMPRDKSYSSYSFTLFATYKVISGERDLTWQRSSTISRMQKNSFYLETLKTLSNWVDYQSFVWQRLCDAPVYRKWNLLMTWLPITQNKIYRCKVFRPTY